MGTKEMEPSIRIWQDTFQYELDVEEAQKHEKQGAWRKAVLAKGIGQNADRPLQVVLGCLTNIAAGNSIHDNLARIIAVAEYCSGHLADPEEPLAVLVWELALALFDGASPAGPSKGDWASLADEAASLLWWLLRGEDE